MGKQNWKVYLEIPQQDNSKNRGNFHPNLQGHKLKSAISFEIDYQKQSNEPKKRKPNFQKITKPKKNEQTLISKDRTKPQMKCGINRGRYNLIQTGKNSEKNLKKREINYQEDEEEGSQNWIVIKSDVLSPSIVDSTVCVWSEAYVCEPKIISNP